MLPKTGIQGYTTKFEKQHKKLYINLLSLQFQPVMTRPHPFNLTIREMQLGRGVWRNGNIPYYRFTLSAPRTRHQSVRTVMRGLHARTVGHGEIGGHDSVLESRSLIACADTAHRLVWPRIPPPGFWQRVAAVHRPSSKPGRVQSANSNRLS